MSEMSRLEVIERADKALRLLLPLYRLTEELKKVDSIDRMTADAEVRAKQAAAQADEMLAAKVAELSRLDALIAQRGDEAAAAKMAAESAGSALLEQARATAAGIAETARSQAAVERAGLGQQLEGARQNLSDMRSQAAEAQERRDALLREAGDIEDRIARARAAAAALLG